MTSSILIKQDYKELLDNRGSRDKARPADLRSGTLFGQYQLRGSILVIKDNLNATSGYLAFGTDMTTIPDSPTTGTGVYIDYRGIFGLNASVQTFKLDSTGGTITVNSGTIGGWTITSTALTNAGGTVTLRGAGNLAFGATPPTSSTVGTGVFISDAGVFGLNANTQEFYLFTSTGKANAGAGAVVLDVNGITLTDANADSSLIKWVTGGLFTGTIGTFSAADDARITVKVNDQGSFNNGRFHAVAYEVGGSSAEFRVRADSTDGLFFTFSGELASIVGVTIGDQGLPDCMLAVKGFVSIDDGSTAPAAVSGCTFIYVDMADGDLKVKFGDGTTKTLATDT